MRSRWVWVLVGMAFAALPTCAAPTYQITAAEVAGVMRAFGISVSNQQVRLLSNVVATTSVPNLQVDSMTPLGSERMMVRLKCTQAAQCLPFNVTVQAGQIRVTQPGVQRPGTSPSSVAQPGAMQSSQRTAPAPAPARFSAQRPAGNLSGTNFLVRSGSPAVLLLEGEKVHIRVQVVCLENGVAGQTIRVAGKGNHKIYTAEVESYGVLAGSL
ncbi:MAG: hypothetical protein ACP5E5_11190 [Acidobacteriaceae bacterium]